MSEDVRVRASGRRASGLVGRALLMIAVVAGLFAVDAFAHSAGGSSSLAWPAHAVGAPQLHHCSPGGAYDDSRVGGLPGRHVTDESLTTDGSSGPVGANGHGSLASCLAVLAAGMLVAFALTAWLHRRWTTSAVDAIGGLLSHASALPRVLTVFQLSTLRM